jgi:plasmid maintenance system antidote protein VapI
LRAFSRALGFEHSVISQIIAGKRVPSLRTAFRLIEALKLDNSTALEFMTSLAETQNARGLKRMNPYFRQLKPRDTV